jgi:hypothetical protein
MHGFFLGFNRYTQGYPQKLGRIRRGINVLGSASINTGDKAGIRGVFDAF